MNVLMTTDAVGGVWTYSLELVDALAEHDVRTTLAVLGPPPSPRQRAQLASSAVVDAVEIDAPLEWMEDPWAELDAAGERLLALAAGAGTDVVHLNGFSYGALPWCAPVVVVAHSDVLSWWDAVHGAEAPPSWGTYRQRVRAGLAAASAVVALTRVGADDLWRHYGGVVAQVIPNGRSAGWVRSEPKQEMILGAGRLWDAAKNVGVLEAAAKHVDWPVYLAGGTTAHDRPDEPPIARGASARMLGHLEFSELAGWMARASVYAAPARYEPFGLGVLEAALSRCALVLGDIPSLREIWSEAAVYVDPDDAQALVAALQLLCRDEQRRDDLAVHALARARELTSQRMACAYDDLYRSLTTAAAR